jgi:hypothetical protein
MFVPSVAILLTAIELELVPPTGTAPNWTAEAAVSWLLERFFGAVGVPPHPIRRIIAASDSPRLYRFGIMWFSLGTNYAEIVTEAIESEKA